MSISSSSVASMRETATRPSFGFYVSERLHPPLDELKKKILTNVSDDEQAQRLVLRDLNVISTIEDAADYYLYRNADKFRECVETLFERALDGGADPEGDTEEEMLESFSALFQQYILGMWNEYLGHDWDKTHEIVLANSVRKHRLLDSTQSQGMDNTPTVQYYTNKDSRHMKKKDYVLVLVYATGMESIGVLATVFEKIAEELHGKVEVGMVDAVTDSRFSNYFNVKEFPTVLMLKHGEIVGALTSENEMTVGKIVQFANSCTSTDKLQNTGSALWKRASSKFYEMRVMSELKTKREFVNIVEKLHALGLQTDLNDDSPQPSNRDYSVDPPTLYCMGGGMGSGKSTVVDVLSQTPFWEKFGRGIVVIEADAMKLQDPVFQALTHQEQAAASVHSYSVQKAEELFLAAISQRKDVVFDGTLMWKPFVMQTIEMVRDNDHVYKRGPGYFENPDGTVTEKYWEAAEKCDKPMMPYRIVLVGVTADAETAVKRGIVRQIVTDRGVPVKGQLKSHMLFSQSFPYYVPIFDEITLYDNNSPDTLLSDSIEEPRIIAHKREITAPLETVREPYEKFMMKRKINMDATCVSELYPDEASILAEFVGSLKSQLFFHPDAEKD